MVRLLEDAAGLECVVAAPDLPEAETILAAASEPQMPGSTEQSVVQRDPPPGFRALGLIALRLARPDGLPRPEAMIVLASFAAP